MKVVKLSFLAAVLTVALAAPSFAQAPKPQTPKPQTPAPAAPAQSPVATPRPAPQPPAPFPQDAKFAFVDIQAIASSSSAGKEASSKLKALSDKKSAEISEKNKQLQALTTKRDQGGTVLNDTARAQMDKEIERLQREIQFAQQGAQAELQDLQNELQGDFQKKLLPIIADIAKEKGLHAVFSAQDAGAAYIHPGLDISDEVIKRLDGKKN